VIAGSRFPCDGIVAFSQTMVDESNIIGRDHTETLPSSKQAGDEVLAGSLNVSNVVYVRVRRAGESK
jgi:cation transport ATPase